MQDTSFPIDSLPLRTPPRHPVFLETKIAKDHNGKTVVSDVANVEVDVLEDENDMFFIPDDELDDDIHVAPRANMDIVQRTIGSNHSMHNSLLSMKNI